MKIVVKFDWSADSKCSNDLDLDHNYFYPKVRASRKEGGRVDAVEAERARYCLGLDDASPCPVRKECLNHALVNGEQGVWGGKTEEERRRMKKPSKELKVG